MSRSRLLGLLALPALVIGAPTSAFAQDVADGFESAMQLWRQGRKQESLDAMRQVLAADPDPSEVFEVYLAADAKTLTAFMAAGEEYTLVARRFLERARVGREALERDEDAIKEAVSSYMRESDAFARMKAIDTIRQKHGVYAAPKFINHLANESDTDKVQAATLGLTGLGSDAVLPLLAALDSPSEFQRRNAALTLGFIGDNRAGAHLLGLSSTDESPTTRAAAARAAESCGASGDPVASLTALGDKYHRGSSDVMFQGALSDVTWAWGDDGLMALETPAAVFQNELAKDAFHRALDVAPDSLEARAGIARESVEILSKLEALSAAGVDVGDALTNAREGMLAVASSGVDALDRALLDSVAAGDNATVARLAMELGDLASAPTEGLSSALITSSKIAQGSTAVALAHIAVRSRSAASADVVAALADAASRRVVKVAVVIDNDAQRASSILGALEGEGVLGQHAGSGTQGIVMLGQLPDVDAILVSDDLGDLTADAVIKSIRVNPAFADTPVYFVSANESLAESFGDRIQGSFAGADGIGALEEVFEAGLDDSRARADALSAQASAALAALARSGRTDLGAVASEGLLGAITGRRDEVAVPALTAMGDVGGADAVDAILAVVNADDASDEARIAAAGAIGAIGSRVSLAEGVSESLRGMLSSDASLAVRTAAARAIGRLGLGAPARAGVLKNVRVRVGGSSE